MNHDDDVNCCDSKYSSPNAQYSSAPVANDVPMSSPSLPSSKNRPMLRERLSGAGVGAALFLTTIAPAGLLSREHFTTQIRKLCRHDETTITQRHSTHPSITRMSDADKKTLRQLCKRQLKFALNQSSHIYDEELTMLAVTDPLIHKTLMSVQEDPTTGIRIRTDHVAAFPALNLVYEHWSEFIGYIVFEAQTKRPYNFAAMLSKKHLPKGFLSHALALELKGSELEFLLQIWHYFLVHLEKRDSRLDWMKMNTYIATILSSGKSLGAFMSPTHLSSFGLDLVRHKGHAPRIFDVFFAIPTVKIHDSVEELVTRVEFLYELASGCQWSLDVATSYALHFSRHVSSNALAQLDHTVFCDTVWMALYRLVDYALSSYRRGGGFLAEEGLSWLTERDLLTLAKMSFTMLVRKVDSDPAGNRKEEALAVFYISQSVDIDRYCKKAVHDALRADCASINLLNSHSRLSSGTQVENGLYDLAFIPQFRNVPYLRRYRLSGEYFVTSDSLPEPPETMIEHFRNDTLRNFSVDTLLLDGHMIVCLRVNGRKRCFDSAGHYPILAGYHTTSGVPLYVAVSRFEDIWYFTYVEEGATDATYTNEEGSILTTHDFFVLALRHNPSDSTPPYPRTRRGAMDPTGPVFWLKFWPEKDPDYFEDSRLTDDHHLKSFLDSFHARCHVDESERTILSGFA